MKENNMSSKDTLIVFEGAKIRRMRHDDQWFFSVVDIIRILTESGSLRQYWGVLKKRDTQLLTICLQLELRPFQATGDGFGLRTRTWRHDHPKLRTALPGDQPPDTAKRFESYDKQRIDSLARSYQPADLPTQRGHTMNLRQIYDITCDRLETQLVTEEKR